ncbi:MAG: MepB family protein [Mycoplasmatales bacterium]
MFWKNGLNVVYREAKITPKKIGQFVVFGKKKKGTNVPYDSTDNIDRLIINVCQKDNIGQFIFNREILIKKILTHKEILDKMAFGLYPPWSKPISKQVITTQKW